MNLSRATVFAPASVGNVAIGFVILGFAVDALGDRITVSRAKAPGVRGIFDFLPVTRVLLLSGTTCDAGIR